MKTNGTMWKLAVLGIAAATAPAYALRMDVKPSSVYQAGTTAGVYLGHTVLASTNMNYLEAGGTYRASCMSPDTDALTGQRTLPASGLLGGLSLIVTIPAQLPARFNMPGWFNVPRGSTLYCTYAWTAHAREGTLNLGVPGVSMPIGGGQASDGGTISFTMRKPGTATGDDDACLP